ncbi:MAG: glycosyltransferase family 2 protein, partial [Thermogutta sp.]
MRFTVFTPTYNRAHTLSRTYESIRRQTIRDFEWVIVDDGSTDGTDELVQQWQQECNDFPIRYFWQPNQHKKVAFNRGVREAKGQWFVPIDSDDELLPD